MTYHYGPMLGERAGLRVIDCKRCGWAHLDKLPDPADMDAFYRNEFWQHEKAGALSRFERQRDWWRAIHGDWLELLGRHIVGDGQRLLDVGAGYGFFLRDAQEAGLDVFGLEPNRDALEYASANVKGGLSRVRPVTWEETYNYYGILVHCLSALWVIEHLRDPLAFLRWAHDEIMRDGLLLIVAPYDFSPAQAEATSKVKVPNWCIHHTHLNYFTPVTLANLLGRAGFRVVEQTTLYPMEHFLVDGMDYTADDALGAELHRQVEEADLELSRDERIRQYADIARRGSGREIVFVGVRE